MDKKTVQYKPTTGDVIRVGSSAYVKPVNHPDKERVSNNNFVFTSRVIKVDSGGVFETLNTIYRPKG